MANEITLKTAKRIIELRGYLDQAQNMVRNLREPNRVVIKVEYITGKNNYGSITTSEMTHSEYCAHSQLARSVASGVLQHWERKRDAYKRELRQLGAEVPDDTLSARSDQGGGNGSSKAS